MKQILTFIGLVILAIIIFSILLIPGMLWTAIEIIRERKSITFITTWLYSIATCIDQLGNVWCAELFNDTLIIEGGHCFGLRKETISSVVGKNYKTGTLTRTGMALNNFLNKIQKNHTTISIDEKV